MTKVYERDPGPFIDGSGLYLGCVRGGFIEDFGVVAIAEDRDGRTATFYTDDDAIKWLRSAA